MSDQHIEKCRSRLRSAENALADLSAASDITSFQEGWYPFLCAWKAVLNVVEQVVKGTPAATTWFNRKKQERKDDPLLAYLFHARNDEEHGLDPSVRHAEAVVRFSIPDAGVENRQISVRVNPRTGKTEPYRTDGGPLIIEEERGPGPALQSVTDRGIIYGPPVQHLGKSISDDPLVVASAGLAWMHALVSEAESIMGEPSHS